MSSFAETMETADRAAQSGDVQAAWRSLQSVLDFPAGAALSDEEFGKAVQAFHGIAVGNMPDKAITAIGAAGILPTRPDLLFELGYQMYEVGLMRFAASALTRANVVEPQNPRIVNELSSALENAGFHHNAFEALRDAPQARAQDWFSRYLYVFNAIMSGHIDEARSGFAELGPPQDENTEFMRNKLVVLLDRFDHCAPHSSMDAQDLRGWHYAVTGGVLTHVSPHGFDQGMNGRYAMIQDSYELIHEGIVRAWWVLQAWNQPLAQMIYSPDRSSEVLAMAWNKRIGVPIKPFDAGDADQPGLFLAYDLLDADPNFLIACEQRSPGQLLISHATCWTQEFPFASDISTILYQHNVVPWGEGRMKVDSTTQQIERLPADTTTPADSLADQVATSTLAEDATADAGTMTAFAAGIGAPPSGRRDRFYIGGPVTSSRFP